MISFYPGPSRVRDEIPQYVREAHKAGILSINHRSPEFVEMAKRTITLLQNKLRIPKNYTIFFTGSATESWEIIAQSLWLGNSYHFHNGAFGQKWYEYTKRLHPEAKSFPFGVNDVLVPPTKAFSSPGVVCLTQNETSNGTQVSNSIIRKFSKLNPECLIAVDCTSSLAGIHLDFKAADIWFASVQKCFGLPAGLGLLICSPKACEAAMTIGENAHYNSLTFLIEMMSKWQTSFTPNVLGIYLLMRVMEAMPPIAEVEQQVLQRYESWINFLEDRKAIHLLVTNKSVRSHTVIPLRADEAVVQKIKREARSAGFLLGEGYGEFKPYTFRIANFPALLDKEIKSLQRFLKKY